MLLFSPVSRHQLWAVVTWLTFTTFSVHQELKRKKLQVLFNMRVRKSCSRSVQLYHVKMSFGHHSHTANQLTKQNLNKSKPCTRNLELEHLLDALEGASCNMHTHTHTEQNAFPHLACKVPAIWIIRAINIRLLQDQYESTRSLWWRILATAQLHKHNMTQGTCWNADIELRSIHEPVC